MPASFYHLSDLNLFCLLSVLSIIISIIAIILIRSFIPHDVRYKDNAVIGSIGALVSIIYGVLVGLTALYLINNVSATADAVQREANATANIYRATKWLKNPTQTTIRTDIKAYLHQAIEKEWPLMEEGKTINIEDEFIIEHIANELHDYSVKNPTDTLLLPTLFNVLDDLYSARQQRIQASSAGINGEMWLVILIGTILTIVINYLFAMNLYLHIVMVGAAALMASSMIFLLITLDRPFQGEFVMEPDALRAVVAFIEKSSTPPTRKLSD